ncbi:DUF4826 family protein [Corallincola spongiicola]|uniref:DUF4826 family protein n=1 Tax=Corallincola spongiicola TaxID=2520508 RepID=A0ABY1WUZ2_9GAMM|nr:DUF4826 family protein [Corallincola spongiicola]TAA48396.1 DUF4826 family protein [Corallincola spongiicola]
MSEAEEKRDALQGWVREQFQKAQKHLASKGIVPAQVLEKESRYLPPLVSIWKIVTADKPAQTVWVISGDLPTDHVEVGAAATARDALRYFGLRWQLQAEQLFQVPNKDKTKVDFANLLVSRAEGLAQLHENDALWVNEGQA